MFKLERFPEARPRLTDTLSFAAEPGTRAALQRMADASGRSLPEVLREAAAATLARAEPARPASAATLADEDPAAVLPEIPALWDAHWSATPHLCGADLAPDWPKLSTLAAGGSFVVTAARLDGVLVGALASLVSTHLHYRSTMVAQVVLDLVRPDCRASDLRARLQVAHEAALKVRGVVKASILAETGGPLAADLARAGWIEAERTFMKDLV